MTIIFLFISMLPVSLLFVSHGDVPQSTARFKVVSEKSESPRMATLYALDPLSKTVCLNDGRPGSVFQDNEVRNRCSDLDFNIYNPGNFTVGIEGSRAGNIVDIGTADELMKKYGYLETVGKGQGFASLRVAGGKVMILKDRKAGTMQELHEGAALLREARTGATAAVRLGHIYLVRLTDEHDKDHSLMVKLIVVDYRPDQSVTIRWELL